MQIKFKIKKEDNEKIRLKYGKELDCKALSYGATTVYNWVISNRNNSTVKLILRISDQPGFAGFYNYGKSLYVNLDHNENYEELIRTIFHEFRHWIQYSVDKRSSYCMAYKSKRNWNSDNAEIESENWEIIGIKILEICSILDYTKEVHEHNSRIEERKRSD